MRPLLIILLQMLLFKVAPGQGSSQYELTKVYYSPKELQDDLTYLFERIEAIHINPYAVTSKDEIYRQIENAKSRLIKPMNSLEFWRIVNPIVVNLHDGHTGLGLTDEKIFLADFYFPFYVEFSPKKDFIIIKRKLSEENNLMPGDKVVSINGKSSHQIIQDLSRNISGEMMSYRYTIAELIFAPLLFWVYGSEKEFKLTYEQNDKTKTTNVTPVSKEIFLSHFEFSFSKGAEPYRLEIIDSLKVALIEFNSFEGRKEFQEFLKTSFDQIKEQGIKNLIIDIRKNGGGNSNLGDDFLKFISNIPFTQYGDILTKVSKEVKEQYPGYKQENGYIMSSPYSERKLIEPYSDSIRFQGNLYVLTSNFTFSSATDFAWCVKHYGLGELIGEETGQWGVNFGELIYTKLPNTGLDVRVAHKKFYCVGANDESHHGAIPDYEVKDSLETKNDEVLEYTLRRISEKEAMHNKH